MEKLTREQAVQEGDYGFPYHWTKTRDTQSGRLYFGYFDICVEELEKHLNTLGLAKTKARILDAGCGDGRFLKQLQDSGFPKIAGVDYSKRALSFGKLLLPDVQLERADFATGTSFQDGAFDAIVMIETLEHIIPSQIPLVLKELARILKKGGIIIVTVPSKAIPVGPKHYQHFDKESMRSTLEPVFTVREIFGQDKLGFHPLKLLYMALDNKLWDIPRARKKYNRTVWAKHFNKCKPTEGRRVIAIAEKNEYA